MQTEPAEIIMPNEGEIEEIISKIRKYKKRPTTRDINVAIVTWVIKKCPGVSSRAVMCAMSFGR